MINEFNFAHIVIRSVKGAELYFVRIKKEPIHALRIMMIVLKTATTRQILRIHPIVTNV